MAHRTAIPETAFHARRWPEQNGSCIFVLRGVCEQTHRLFRKQLNIRWG